MWYMCTHCSTDIPLKPCLAYGQVDNQQAQTCNTGEEGTETYEVPNTTASVEQEEDYANYYEI